MTKEDGLDEISDTVENFIKNMQDTYIKTRLRLFWKLPVIRGVTVHLITLLFSRAITTYDIENTTMTLTQQVMLVSKYEYLARILMKMRK